MEKDWRPKSSSNTSIPAVRNMAHHRSRTRRRRLAAIRLLLHIRMGMELPDAFRPPEPSFAVRPYNRTRHLYEWEIRQRFHFTRIDMRSIEEKLRQSRTAGTEQIDFPTLEAQRKALLKRIVDGDVLRWTTSIMSLTDYAGVS